MKGDPEERAAAVGRYIAGKRCYRARGGCRIRREQIHDLEGPGTACAAQNPGLWAEVQAVVQKNKAERHLRGGEATRRKYLHTASCAAHGGTV